MRLLSLFKKRVSSVQRSVLIMEADSTQSTKFVIKAWASRFYFEKKYLAINKENLLVYLASKATFIDRQ